jgi:hypothetical protein
MAVGNMAAFLPGILEVLRTDKKKEYLLLASLKEVIVLHAEQPADTSTQPSLSTSASPWLFQCSGGFAPFLEPVLERLLGFSTSPEEGVRNMVAECLGALVAMYPDRIVQQLHDLLLDQATSSSAGAGGGAAAAADSSSSGDGREGGGGLEGAVAMRWTVAASLKYAMTASNAPHAVLSSHMGFFLALLQDADLTVVHASLQMCNAAVHHQPQLAAPFLAEAIGPALYARVTFKQERMVDLGPFKQKVDDGLPLRKAALATVNTILDTMPERFDVAAFVEPLKVSFVCECVSSSSLSVVVDLRFFPPNLFKLYLSTPPEYLINKSAYLYLYICLSCTVWTCGREGHVDLEPPDFGESVREPTLHRGGAGQPGQPRGAFAHGYQEDEANHGQKDQGGAGGGNGGGAPQRLCETRVRRRKRRKSSCR